MKKKAMIILIVATMLAIQLAAALTIDVNSDKEIYSYQELVKISSLIAIQDPDTQLPITNFTVKINGPVKDECTFLINGENSCPSFTIIPIATSSAYGFDNSSVIFDGNLYDFNESFGYGYNESSSEFRYDIIWNSTNSPLGRYVAIFYINTGNDIRPLFSEFNSFKIANFDLPEIAIISPNKTIYGKRQIPIMIKSNKLLEKIEISDNNKPFQRLCNRCSSFSRLMSFNDGDHKIIIKGTDEFNNLDQEEFSFKVISKPPIIFSFNPKKTTNGKFEIFYSEENLKDTTFYYRSSSSSVFDSISLGFINQTCPSGMKKKCSFLVNITDFPSPLEYFIVLSNEALSSSTKPTKVYIDNNIPEITLNYQQQDKKLNLDIQLTEKARLTYSIDNGLPRVICNNCNHATKLLFLNYGKHNIIINSIDGTGNSDTETMEITIW